MGSKQLLTLGTKRCLEISVVFVLIVILAGLVSAGNYSIKTEYSPQWGGTTPDDAYDYDFGESWFETFWNLPGVDDGDDWYYTETDENGVLVFELDVIGSGGDLDLYVYDWEANELLCYSNEYGMSTDESCTVDKFNNNNWGFYIRVVNYDLGANFYADAYVNSYVADCTDDNDCDMYEECNSDYECEPLSCSEIDPSYTTCSSSQEDDPACTGVSNNRKVCKEFATNVFCWMPFGHCASDEYCEDGSCIQYECMTNSDCSSYEKCSNHECVPKTCSDYSGTDGSCGTLNQQHCDVNQIEKCEQFGNLLCWKEYNTCTSDQYCSNGYCYNYPCDLTSAYWNSTLEKENNTVALVVNGNYCNGKTINFEIWEYDPVDFDDSVNINPSPKIFNGNTILTTWKAEWQDDGAFGLAGDPEYYFKATTSDDAISSSNQLTVTYSQLCSDFGLTSCLTEGGYKKESNTIYECIDQYDWDIREVLCWENVSTLGDNGFCDHVQCSRNEWDCDSSSQCTTNRCTGSALCLGWECGCCNSNEDWDKTNNACKLLNGQTCSGDSQCYNGFCVHNVCASTKWLPNDGYCDESQGETCSNSVSDCGKCDLQSCTSASQCYGGYCVHNLCWHNAWRVGDGFCDSSAGENPSNSQTDCFENLVVMEIIESPSNVQQGETFQVRAKLKNTGTYSGELKLESGIESIEWGGDYDLSSEGNYSPMSYVHITKCCPGNSYYNAVKITLNAGEEEIVTFNLIAPTIHSVDACAADKRSAWGDSHTLIVGLYTACGQGYVNYQAQSLDIAERYCYSNSECNSNEYCMRNSSLQGICRPGYNCVNDCTSVGVGCEGTNIAECGYFDNDSCLDKRITSCVSGKICVNGQCVIQASVTGLEMDYSGRKDIQINKQQGDILLLNLIYKGTETVELEYDSSSLTLSNCSKSFTITKNTQCILKINNNATKKIYTVGIKNGQKGTLNVITPKTIIVTDKDRLIQRYGSEKEVTALLAEAYELAASKDGVVYNLGDSLDDSMLWNNFNEYSGGEYK